MSKGKIKNSDYVTRFAPSPSGRLHKGHAFSALTAYRLAQENGGRFLLRIEDIDASRCKPEFVEGIYEDLAWLDLDWDRPVRLQSEHYSDYTAALDKLKTLGALYPCFCTRKDIREEIQRAESAPHAPKRGTTGLVYPGLCRGKDIAKCEAMIAEGKPHAWRLDLKAALKKIKGPLIWHDEIKGDITAVPHELGDVVLARKDMPTSYHLSVVVDDAVQGINHIIRGEDLFQATHIHIVLQKLLGLATPAYHHHALLLDEQGERFAKRNKSATLENLQTAGVRAADLINELFP